MGTVTTYVGIFIGKYLIGNRLANKLCIYLPNSITLLFPAIIIKYNVVLIQYSTY